MKFAPGAIGFDQMQRARLEASATGQTITAAPSTPLTLNMATCVRNDIILASLFCQGVKGATSGLVSFNISKDAASTGEFEWDGANNAGADQRHYINGDNVAIFQSRIGRVTVGGTIILNVVTFSLGSNVTAADVFAQAWILRGE